jgi:hypothetical protein
VGAVQHLWDVLRLDPADHRWVRFPLASWLFQMEDERALKHLIRICFRVTDQIGPWTINSINGEHVEHCTFFFYLQALMAFRRYGPRTNRRSGLNRFETSLYEGLCENRLAAQFLLGRVPLPEVRVRKIYSDPLLEAIHCAQHSLELWQSVPGALKCLAEVFDRREHGLSRAIVRKTR